MTTLFAFVGMPGPFELGVILIIAVLLFGGRLPKLAYSAGNSIVQFKKGFKECELEIAETEKELTQANKDIETIAKSSAKDLEDIVKS